MGFKLCSSRFSACTVVGVYFVVFGCWCGCYATCLWVLVLVGCLVWCGLFGFYSGLVGFGGLGVVLWFWRVLGAEWGVVCWPPVGLVVGVGLI